MSDQTVITKIKTSPIRFNLSAGELIKLKTSRVSDAIIETMLTRVCCQWQEWNLVSDQF
jgi:hypothetical protein